MGTRRGASSGRQPGDDALIKPNLSAKVARTRPWPYTEQTRSREAAQEPLATLSVRVRRASAIPISSIASHRSCAGTISCGPVATARSRRWHSHQANVTGRGIVASYSARFWAIAVGLGVLTGAAASALVALLHVVEHLAFGYERGLVPGRGGRQPRTAPRHRAAGSAADRRCRHHVLRTACRLRRRPRSPRRCGCTTPRCRYPEPRLGPWCRSSPSASGCRWVARRAPQLAGAARASWLSDWARLPTWQRRLLVASGAGAGFAAVYNVPLGGALFALEVLLGTLALPLVLPALATSVIATASPGSRWAPRPPTTCRPTRCIPQQLAWAALVGPVIGVAAIVLGADHRAGPAAHRPRDAAATSRRSSCSACSDWSRSGTRSCSATARASSSSPRSGSCRWACSWILFVLKPLATAACLDRLARGPVHADADRRRPAGRDPGRRLVAPLPGRPDRGATRSSAAGPSWPPRCRGRCPGWSWCSS